MKKYLVLSAIALISIGCGNSATTTTVQQTNTNVSAPKTQDSQAVSSHSADKPLSSRTTTGSTSSSSTSSSTANSPMQKAVDVSAQTADIEKAEKEYKAKPADAKAKDNLATAYFKRAFVLTEAAQYRAALGDFRKGLKLKPDDQEAKGMHDQIISIFQSIGREPPKEGEEPSPMSIEKGK